MNRAAALTATLLCAASITAQADSWTGKDKAQHFEGGAITGAVGTLVFKDANKGFALGTAVGLLKEVYDVAHRDKHTPSAKDFAVTVFGAYLGSRVAGLVVTPNRVTYARQF